MKIVIDTNRIIAALIKNGLSRKIILDKNFEFYTIDSTISEIYKYQDEIIEKTNISNEEFEILLGYILDSIIIIPKEEYENFIGDSINLIEDIGGIEFIALCLALKADGIWTDDAHFQKQTKVKIFSTQKMFERSF